MASNLTVMGNKEILLVAETIAHEKGIPASDIIHAMEEGIKSAAKKKYGHHLNIDCVIDAKTGSIKLYNQLRVVENKFATENSEEEDAQDISCYADSEGEEEEDEHDWDSYEDHMKVDDD